MEMKIAVTHALSNPPQIPVSLRIFSSILDARLSSAFGFADLMTGFDFAFILTNLVTSRR
jgi:hypothetical protein